MALFEYFPNYIWNLSVAMALESGGRIGEIVDMCQPLRDAAASGADAGTPQFMAQWVAKADTLVELAGEDEALDCARPLEPRAGGDSACGRHHAGAVDARAGGRAAVRGGLLQRPG